MSFNSVDLVPLLFFPFSLSTTNADLIGMPCDTTSVCTEKIVNSICRNNECRCKVDNVYQEVNNISYCTPCPALGEQCSDYECCRHSSYIACIDGMCRCRDSYDGIHCWSASSIETVQFTSIAQMILGIALVFTILVLGSLVWRLCASQEPEGRTQDRDLHRETSFASLNSIQRLVLIRLQDRPPPYNPSCQPWKCCPESASHFPHPNQRVEIMPYEAPPPYTITVSSQGPITLTHGGLPLPLDISGSTGSANRPTNQNAESSSSVLVVERNVTESVHHI